MRRNNWKAKRAANFAMMCLRTQRDNAQQLESTVVLTYESLVQDPAAVCAKLAAFKTDLADMDHSASFEVHSIDGTLSRPITDLNAKKIDSLSAEDIAVMTAIFTEHGDTLEYWGYEKIPG